MEIVRARLEDLPEILRVQKVCYLSEAAIYNAYNNTTTFNHQTTMIKLEEVSKTSVKSSLKDNIVKDVERRFM